MQLRLDQSPCILPGRRVISTILLTIERILINSRFAVQAFRCRALTFSSENRDKKVFFGILVALKHQEPEKTKWIITVKPPSAL
jgi:hypothetical protein